MLKKFIFLAIILLSHYVASAQFLMDMIDTTKPMGKNMLGLYEKYNKIRITGYMQPQFQMAESKGLKNYSGGDFGTEVNNRFMLRRGRIRFDYVNYSDKGKPDLQFVFQFDGTERGVNIRDFWGRYFENKWELFSITGGMFARPFGYEVNLSSGDRETPERGRMSQILMKTERDMGAMISFEPRNHKNLLRYIKWDLGLFNGQGLAATADFDSHKDIISRLSLKPYPINKNLSLSLGLSYLNGGILQKNANRMQIQTLANGNKDFVKDPNNLSNSIAPRKYIGADVQLKQKIKAGIAEFRAEYWRGTQTASIDYTESPAVLLTDPLYTRKFDGGFFYYLRNIGNKHHQVVVKYDWYDPNRLVKGKEIGNGNQLHATNIRYNTLGFGYIHYINEHLKMVAWYEKLKNESTSLTGYQTDLKDDIFTLRFQFRF